MLKRTIEISREAAHITTQHRQIQLKRKGEVVGSVPCEDLGLVLVDHPGTTYTHNALTALLDANVALVVCGKDHLPKGVLVPLSDHLEIVWRIEEQTSVSKPVRKRLWKQIVQAKIRAQAANLTAGSIPHRKLINYAREVKADDSSNREAVAARLYWSSWLVNCEAPESLEPFRRDRDGEAPNNFLNYGYAILRAAIARSLVAAGLLPAIGIHHHNRSNAFCLADDLIEPLRPLVDAKARDLYFAGHSDMDQEAKQTLLDLLTETVTTGNQNGPLMVALNRMTASLVNCFQGTRKDLEIPVPCISADTEVCGS